MTYWIGSLVALMLLGGCMTPAAPGTSRSVDSAAAPVTRPAATRAFAEAEALLRAGRLDEAEQQFLLITQRWPDFTSPWTNLGFIYRQRGEWPAAADALERAIDNDSSDCTAWIHLAAVHQAQFRFRQAESSLQQCLERQPDHAAAWMHLGVLYELKLGDLPRALHAYEQYQLSTTESDSLVERWIADLNRRIQQSQSLAGGAK